MPAWRDLSVRYKQNVVGEFWDGIFPCLTMLMFDAIFGRIAPSDGGVPNPLPVFVGLPPWTEASNSLNNNSHLISKFYFPRLIIPATVAVSFVDILISFVILIFLMLWYWFLPSWRTVFLPVFVVFARLTSIEPSLWIADLNDRDFLYIMRFVVQFDFYLSPVGFCSSVVTEQWRLLYAVNPMVGAIEGFRWCILSGQSPLYIPGLAVGLGSAFFTWQGIRQFRKFEKTFADLI